MSTVKNCAIDGAPGARLARICLSRHPGRSRLKRRVDLNAGSFQRLDQLLGVLAVARFDEELYLRAADRSGAEDALVLDLDDVAAGRAETPGDRGRAPR